MGSSAVAPTVAQPVWTGYPTLHEQLQVQTMLGPEAVAVLLVRRWPNLAVSVAVLECQR